ncbi:MAG TPA: cobalt-precorrin-5B (C(1))-methyltransferase CbiD [Methanobacterium sp.]|jgi:cobalt-precorrin-5B (C1)-methyltransferase|nr:MAG: cobalamin biosynthesis protein CbiD [Methanobacterium sp.]HOI71365.1 cobalt-precorrin-5B (C(1))-methyltransferase CbiD [Methanobacterium sp.]
METIYNNPDTPVEEIKYGITTGSGATAAARAALLVLNDEDVKIITIKTPMGNLEIEVEKTKKLTDTHGQASVIKRPYNDPDVTVNIEIIADLWITDTEGISIKGGEGVGQVTKPGLQVPPGKPAINPTPQKMIKENLSDLIPEGKGACVEISVPAGRKLAEKTINPKLGIIGGISILGTTGIARSMNLESYKKSFKCQMDVALAEGYQELIFVPGNIGEKIAQQILTAYPDQIIQMGNFPGYMLQQAAEMDVKHIILLGHAGKIIKLAAGIFNTEHKVADGRREIIAAHAALNGANKNLIGKIFNANTTEEMMGLLEGEDLLEETFNSIAQSVKDRSQERFPGELEVIMVKMDGTVLNTNHHVEIRD